MRRAQPLKLSTLTAALVLVTSALWPMAASAGLFDDEEARKAIVDLRSRFEQSQRAAQTEENERKALAGVVAEQAEQINVLKRSLLDLNGQMETLRTEIAKLRGADEQLAQGNKDLARELADLQRKYKDMVATIDDRIRRLEPQRVSLDGKDAVVDAPEKKAYDEAIGILRKGEFANAATALAAFQKRFPSSAYNGHVQYWLGNALYGKGEVKEAMAIFRTLVTSTPDHPRASEALLALANCQIELKDSKGARKTLEELIANYPQSEAAQSGRERIKQLK
ncbi:tol-pal system protein YbgF [Sphaerotilus sp.]|jgi:tol-pal system protein YbgF|uniref:tol-pal system protein YbgF n=1 Tax=Sphaerotilus sp. TaxID=2093942 RepID=UPI0025F3F0CE|nr:tol-pal system protein YbgF [Sphaerotilus sp.]